MTETLQKLKTEQTEKFSSSDIETEKTLPMATTIRSGFDDSDSPTDAWR